MLRPSLPKYSETWDLNTVLSYLETLIPVKNLTPEELSHKLLTLIAILSGQTPDYTLPFFAINDKDDEKMCVLGQHTYQTV